MSSVESLREFVSERLTAAAEEIFGVFRQTIVEYEEEIDRQRRLLDMVWKPQIKLHRIELPQQHVCTEEEVLTVQQLCIQESNSSLDQEDPKPPQIKEEREQLVLSDAFMWTPTYEESDHSKDESLKLKPDKTVIAAEKDSVVNTPVNALSEPSNDHQLLSHNSQVAESQDQKDVELGHSGSTRDAEPEPNKRRHKSRRNSNKLYNPNLSENHHNSHTAKKSFKCNTCEKTFKFKSQMNIHMRTHTREKPHTCNTCGKRFNEASTLKQHTIIHSSEKPYSCKTCGRAYSRKNDLKVHMRTHTFEEPCTSLEKGLKRSDGLLLNKRMHTDEKLYYCKICGRDCRCDSALKIHMRIHTGEKPYPCNTCGKMFSRRSDLNRHTSIHTGEKAFPCTMCEAAFRRNFQLKLHMKRAHIGENL